MAKETLRNILNNKNQPKLIINTDVLLALGDRNGIVYAKLVELDSNKKVKRVNESICCSREYICKYIPYSVSTFDRALKDLKKLGLVKTKLHSNGENIYKFNHDKAEKVFIYKTLQLEDLKELKSKTKDNPWGYDEQLVEEKKSSKKKRKQEDDSGWGFSEDNK